MLKRHLNTSIVAFSDYCVSRNFVDTSKRLLSAECVEHHGLCGGFYGVSFATRKVLIYRLFSESSLLPNYHTTNNNLMLKYYIMMSHDFHYL